MRRLEPLQFVDEQSFQLRSAPTGRVTQDSWGLGWRDQAADAVAMVNQAANEARHWSQPQDVTARLFPTAAFYARFINPHRTRAPV